MRSRFDRHETRLLLSVDVNRFLITTIWLARRMSNDRSLLGTKGRNGGQFSAGNGISGLIALGLETSFVRPLGGMSDDVQSCDHQEQ